MKKYFIITIDTEGHKGTNPIDNLVFGKIQNEFFGIDKIMDICDKYCVKAIFFVDIAAVWHFGEEKIINAVKRITERGHDIQVHIHPDHMYDEKRLFLWEYEYDEQYDIIKKVVDKYREITGKNPIAFRAGKYGANYDTLDILDKLGLKLDLSSFYSQKWCKIKPELTINTVGKYKGLFEIPVTVYNSLHLMGLKRIDKLDVNSTTLLEFKCLIKQIERIQQPCIITIFMHSFSFLKRYDSDNSIKPNFREIKKFDKMMQILSRNRDFSVVTSEEIVDIIEKQALNDSKDYFLSINNLLISIYGITRRAIRIYKNNKKARILIIIEFIVMIIAICLVILFLKH